MNNLPKVGLTGVTAYALNGLAKVLAAEPKKKGSVLLLHFLEKVFHLTCRNLNLSVIYRASCSKKSSCLCAWPMERRMH